MAPSSQDRHTVALAPCLLTHQRRGGWRPHACHGEAGLGSTPPVPRPPAPSGRARPHCHPRWSPRHVASEVASSTTSLPPARLNRLPAGSCCLGSSHGRASPFRRRHPNSSGSTGPSGVTFPPALAAPVLRSRRRACSGSSATPPATERRGATIW